MKLIKILLIYILSVTRMCAGDDITIDFIKSFVVNENKATIIIFNSLCWNQNLKIKLATTLSNAGFRSSGASVLPPEYMYHNLLFLLDLDCPNVSEAVYDAISRNLFASPFRWLMLSSSANTTALSLVLNSPILVDSDVVLAEKIGREYKLTELYKASLGGPALFTPRGHYNGSLVHTARSLFSRRRDVMGHTLTMSNVIQDSNTTQYHLPREDRLEPQYDSIAKICWMEVRLAFEMLNATPRYIFSHRWGYKQNGQWSGMIDDLHTGRADLGTNCLVSDKERLDVVTYTDMVAPFRVRFVFRQPPLSYVANIYSLPFAASVWIAIVVCVAVSTAGLFLATKWENTIGTLYNDPIRQKIYKKIDPEKGKGQFYNINEGVERIRQGLFAFHSIVEPVYRRIEETFQATEKCDLEEVDFLNGFDPFIPVKKNSPYLELLRVVFKQIRESGVQSCLVKRLQVSRPRCASTSATFSSVGLRELRPVLYFMMHGASLAFATMLAERVTHKLLSSYYKRHN